jgi:hypothetical protein
VTVVVPVVAWAPLQAPPAVHDVAFVLDQVSEAVEPVAMVAGLTFSVTVGAGVAGALTLKAAVAAAVVSWLLPPKLALSLAVPP